MGWALKDTWDDWELTRRRGQERGEAGVLQAGGRWGQAQRNAAACCVEGRKGSPGAGHFVGRERETGTGKNTWRDIPKGLLILMLKKVWFLSCYHTENKEPMGIFNSSHLL